MGYGEINTNNADSVGLFALPALFITFRETLEAAIVVSVLLGLLDRVNMPELKKYVWLGVVSATALCIFGAVVVLILFNVAKNELFEGNAELKAEGVVNLIAAVLIAVVALSVGDIMAIHDKLERRFDEELAQHGGNDAITKNMILFLSFTAVAREGLETIIFFTGIGAAFPPESLPIPAIVGALIGVGIGIALYRFGGRLTIRVFFRGTMVLLVFIGAGIWTNGWSILQTLGAFGTWEPEEERAPLNDELFDISSCCGLDNQFWVLLRVLFGYSPNPTGTELLLYFTFHLVVWGLIIIKFKRAKADKPPLKHVLKQFLCCKSSPAEPVASGAVVVAFRWNKAPNSRSEQHTDSPAQHGPPARTPRAAAFQREAHTAAGIRPAEWVWPARIQDRRDAGELHCVLPSWSCWARWMDALTARRDAAETESQEDGERRGLTPLELADMLLLFLFMVGISSTISWKQIRNKLRRPRSLFIGLFAQYVYLPPVGFLVSKLMGLNGAHTVGLIAICCSPGGTASNVMCQMFRADVALSITLTAISSFLAFVFLPANLHIYLSRTEAFFKVNPWDLSKFTLLVVIGTLVGIGCRKFLHKKPLRVVQMLGSFSTIYLLVKSILDNARSAEPIWKLSGTVIVSVVIPIVGGHLFGLLTALAMKVPTPSAVAIALEVSVQNKLLALGLVGVIFEHDEANVAKAIPLLYGTVSMTFNAIALLIYWKRGWTYLSPRAPWFAPFLALFFASAENTESKIKNSTVPAWPPKL
ncbi:High affinity iron permease 1, partial [Durusdinium trenchii]